MKKLFNFYLELKLFNQFFIIIFIFFNILLTKVFLFVKIDTKDFFIYRFLCPTIDC